MRIETYMDAGDLHIQLQSLLALPHETEWVEFKHNNATPDEIGEYLSALSNSAGLLGKEVVFIVWGVEDETRRVGGTTFKPKAKRVGN